MFFKVKHGKWEIKVVEWAEKCWMWNLMSTYCYKVTHGTKIHCGFILWFGRGAEESNINCNKRTTLKT